MAYSTEISDHRAFGSFENPSRLPTSFPGSLLERKKGAPGNEVARHTDISVISNQVIISNKSDIIEIVSVTVNNEKSTFSDLNTADV